MCNFTGILVQFCDVSFTYNIDWSNLALQMFDRAKIATSRSQFRIQIVPVLTRPEGFSINFQKFSMFFVSWLGQYWVCFFVAEVLPHHRGQNTVKGRLTQASKEKWRQALRGFFGGQVTERGRKRIPLFR